MLLVLILKFYVYFKTKLMKNLKVEKLTNENYMQKDKFQNRIYHIRLRAMLNLNKIMFFKKRKIERKDCFRSMYCPYLLRDFSK